MAKRQRHEEHENHERWLVSYADFITLLFAFFAVLYATSQADLRKQEEFQESIKRSFSGFAGFGGGAQFDEFTDAHANSIIKPPIELFPPMGAPATEVEDAVKGRLKKDLTEKESKETVADVRHDAVGVKVQLASSKLFPAGSAELSDDAIEALDKIGWMLKDSGRKIIVEGHTDDTPTSGRYPSNWELSAARATKIVRYLMAKHRIPSSRLVPVAYADQRPVVPNTSEENRARNRRIEIKIVTGDSAL